MNSTIVYPKLLVQCFLLFFGTTKNSNLASLLHILTSDVLATTNARPQQIAQPSLLSIMPSHLQLGQQDIHGCGK